MRSLSFVPTLPLQFKPHSVLSISRSRDLRARWCAKQVSTNPRHVSSPDTNALPPSHQIRHSGIFLRAHWRSTVSQISLTTAIDATAGRGSDAIALGTYIGTGGTLHAFDIQQAALDETRQRYEQASEDTPMAELCLHRKSHHDLGVLGLSDRSVACVVYNLGWYPGKDADRAVVTKVDTTVKSLVSAERLVGVGGLISVMAYVGHASGKEEELAVREWASALDCKMWSVCVLTYPNRQGAPTLVLCERVAD